MSMRKINTYNNYEITFNLGNNEVMVNATEMAKPFGKQVRQWFDNLETHDFIEALAKARGLQAIVGKRTSLNTSHLADIYPTLIKVVRGGTPGEVQQGTWMHQDVALEFARWLSPTFAIWCNDRIKELLTHGLTATQPTIEEIISNPDTIIQLATILKEERARKELYQEQNRLQTIELTKQAPKVNYFDKVMQSKSLIPITVIAKELGMSGSALNLFLKDLGIQYKISGQWVLHSKYQNKGYTGTKTTLYKDSLGREKTQMHTYWTEKGRKFIHDLIDSRKERLLPFHKCGNMH